jgi:hypothetical protein
MLKKTLKIAVGTGPIIAVAKMAMFLLSGCVTKDTVPTALDRSLNVNTTVTDLGPTAKRIEN